VVALRALGLGDFLTGVPAYRALRRAFPGAPLLLAAPAVLAPLARLTGAVDEVVDTAPLAPLDPRLHGAAVAVNLHGRGPQSTALLRAGGPQRLIAFGQGVDWRPGEHEVARWCRLLAGSGIPADPADLRIRAPAGADVPAIARGATLVHPGAASPARRWPPERFAAVARAEHAGGRAVVVTGGPAEVALARAVAEAAGLPAEAVLAGATDLERLAALVAAAGRVVCGDTGVAHLATALGTPSVVLFGPVAPAEWGPPPGGRHVALWRGRRGDPHGAEPDPGLLEIGVEDVCHELDTLDTPRFPGPGSPGSPDGEGPTIEPPAQDALSARCAAPPDGAAPT
jgi:ADP-heptose:LPS heptosyltransferase